MNVNYIIKFLIPIIPLVLFLILQVGFKVKLMLNIYKITMISLVIMYFIFLIAKERNVYYIFPCIIMMIVYVVIYYHIGANSKVYNKVINKMNRLFIGVLIIFLVLFFFSYLLYCLLMNINKNANNNEEFVRNTVLLYILFYLVLSLTAYIIDLIIKKCKRLNCNISIFKIVDTSLIIILLFHFFAYNYLSALGTDNQLLVYKVLPIFDFYINRSFLPENAYTLQFFLSFELLLISFKEKILEYFVLPFKLE